MTPRAKLHRELRESTNWTFSQIAAYISGYLAEPLKDDEADWPDFYSRGQEDAACSTSE